MYVCVWTTFYTLHDDEGYEWKKFTFQNTPTDREENISKVGSVLINYLKN